MKQLTHAQKEKRREYSRKWWAENKSVAAREKKAAKKIPAKKVQPPAPVESNSDLLSIVNAYKTLLSAAKGKAGTKDTLTSVFAEIISGI